MRLKQVVKNIFFGDTIWKNIVSLINLWVEKQNPPFSPTELDLEAGNLISHENINKLRSLKVAK